MRSFFYTLLVFALASCVEEQKEVVRSQLDLEWELSDDSNQHRYPAEVPGDVYTTLIKEQVIPHPFAGVNEGKVQWVSDSSWKYSGTWHVTDSLLAFSHVDLIFQGLDTYAKIKLNDSLVATTNNMFRTWELPVRSLLRSGSNTLEVEFEPPVEKGVEARQALGVALPADNDVGQEKVSPYVRKAGYHFGWDFAPRMVTSGIWKPIEVRYSTGIFIEDVAYDYAFTDDGVKVDTHVRVQSDRNDELTVRVWHEENIVAHQLVKVRSGGQMAPLTFELQDVERWWPTGEGKQQLYKFYVEILAAGDLIDSHSEFIGFRTIILDRSRDEKGERFQFIVNGKPLFMKGANMVPPTTKEGESDEDAWLRMVTEMEVSHMNMVRIWGGGVYPPDAFFNACDRAGILVWQDLMFANTMVPDGEAFLQNVEAEVREQATRLRDHPSLALWCGNNEIEVAWNNWGWQDTYELSESDSTRLWRAYERLFKRGIPDWIRSEDRLTPYVHTSPISNWGNAAGLQTGDLHYWGVFHGDAAIAELDQNVGRFVSEYGMQSYPSLKTLQPWTDSLALNYSKPFWSSRQKSYKRDGPILNLIEQQLWPPVGPDEFVRLGQVCQAMAYERAIKAHRFSNGHCAGTLYWQLNDVWPGASWAGIDHTGKWKASQYAVEENYRPEVMRFIVEEDSLWIELHADKEKYQGELNVRLFHTYGELLWSERIAVHADRVGGWPMRLFLNKAAKTKLILFAEWNDGQENVLAEEEFIWVRPGDLWQAKAKFEVTREVLSRDSYQFHVSTDKPVWRTWLDCSGFEPDIQCFALPPDRVKTVIERSAWSADQLKFVVPEVIIRGQNRRYGNPSLFSGLRVATQYE